MDSPRAAEPVSSCCRPGLFLALLICTQRPKIHPPESMEISLDGGQGAGAAAGLPGKTRSSVYVSNGVSPRKTSGGFRKRVMGPVQREPTWDVCKRGARLDGSPPPQEDTVRHRVPFSTSQRSQSTICPDSGPRARGNLEVTDQPGPGAMAGGSLRGQSGP